MIRQHAKSLQRDILWRMLLTEGALPRHERFFLDYALPDNVPFWEMENLTLLPEVWRASVRFRYRHVFILESLPFVEDHVRTASPSGQECIRARLEEMYKALGYVPFKIPKATLQERVDMICEVIGR